MRLFVYLTYMSLCRSYDVVGVVSLDQSGRAYINSYKQLIAEKTTVTESETGEKNVKIVVFNLSLQRLFLLVVFEFVCRLLCQIKSSRLESSQIVQHL